MKGHHVLEVQTGLNIRVRVHCLAPANAFAHSLELSPRRLFIIHAQGCYAYAKSVWTGPLARLSLSSVCFGDKGQVPLSGIGPLSVLFIQNDLKVGRVKKLFLSPIFTVTTVWNTGETGDIYRPTNLKGGALSIRHLSI